VIAYAESSAVLAWVLGEPRGETVRGLLTGCERVLSSTLTHVECARALTRGVATGRLDRTDALAAQKLVDGAAATWILREMSGPVLSRARSPFPAEPIRTLDAIHLATALVFRDALPSLTMITLDERVRSNATALGLQVAP
jgi:predicted nucleic acid-binding protein